MTNTVKFAVTMALEKFIRRRENRRLLEKINAAYESEPDDEETKLRERMRRHHRHLVNRET